MTDKVGSKPSFLIVMTDQHDPMRSAPYGRPFVRTPSMDRLAREGVTFRHAYCNTPLCAPSRMSFMTGRYVHHIGAWDNSTPHRSDLVHVGPPAPRARLRRRPEREDAAQTYGTARSSRPSRNSAGLEIIIGFQIDGQSRLGPVCGWKMFHLPKMVDIRELGQFARPRPDYDPAKLRISTLCCHLSHSGDT